VYSIDEAFLDLSGMPKPALEHCRALRERILKWVGVPVSVGIAPSKTLAKAAARVAKKDPAHRGVFDITGRTDVTLAGASRHPRPYSLKKPRHARGWARAGDAWQVPVALLP
jgi:hypothetical protein